MKLLLCLLFSMNAYAQLSFKDARINLVPPGVKMSAGFLKIRNKSESDLFLVDAKAKWAKKVELHTHALEDGIMSMRKVEKLKIPQNGELILKSKSHHLMIFNIQDSLKEGEKKNIELLFSDGSSEQVKFKIQRIKPVLMKKHEH